MIEKGEDMVTIFDDSLLKRDHLFVLWFHRLQYETNPEIHHIKERNRLFINC